MDRAMNKIQSLLIHGASDKTRGAISRLQCYSPKDRKAHGTLWDH